MIIFVLKLMSGDDGEDGEGEGGMIGLGGYVGSPMDEVEDDTTLDVLPTSSPVQLVGGFASPSASMPPPPPSAMHFYRIHQQQQQMALNAATSVHHSHHDMDNPRIANLLLNKNGNGFSQSSNGSNFGFHQQRLHEG
jgi:hypothetical protein